MAIRTTQKAVAAVLGDDYDGTRDLTPFIRGASLIVDRVATCATNKGKALSAAELTEIETWVAAHRYTKSDPTYSSRSTAGASGAFIRDPQTPEPYKAGAIEADPSGCLKAILNGQRAGGVWLGRPPSEQTPYLERD